MKLDIKDQDRLVRYLLGQLSDDEQALIEQRYLDDPEFHQELQAVERDLIDAYVLGELTDRTQFEKHFLCSPSRRQKVEFARALMESLGRTSGAKPRASVSKNRVWWKQLHPAFVYLAAGVVILAAGLLIVSRQRQEVPQTAKTPPAVETTPAPPSPPSPAPEVAPPVATLILMPTLTRESGQPPTLAVAAGVQVSLELHLEESLHPRYRARIRTVEGQQVWTQEQIPVQQRNSSPALVVSLPSERLSGGDYLVAVFATEDTSESDEIANYYFRVRR